jgi:hypothetical protein
MQISIRPAKLPSRATNLAKTKLGTQCREEGHRNDTDNVEEEDTQNTIGEASVEQ